MFHELPWPIRWVVYITLVLLCVRAIIVANHDSQLLQGISGIMVRLWAAVNVTAVEQKKLIEDMSKRLEKVEIAQARRIIHESKNDLSTSDLVKEAEAFLATKGIRPAPDMTVFEKRE